MAYTYQGCPKSSNCYRAPGHTARCGRIDKSIPPPPRWDADLSPMPKSARTGYVPTATVTDAAAIDGVVPYRVEAHYALRCGQSMPQPGSTRRRIFGPALVTIEHYPDGGQHGIEKDAPDSLKCMRIDCGHCNPETEEKD